MRGASPPEDCGDDSRGNVMAGRSRSKNGVASLAYVPAIPITTGMHGRFIGMPGTRPGMTTPRFQNKSSCSEAGFGGLKCSIVVETLALLKPSRSQATSKRRPIIQASGPLPVMRWPQLES